MEQSQNAVELKNVAKRFNQWTLFENIDLQIPTASITGISGPNGAGKSMLLRIICGLVKPTAGQVLVWGKRIGEERDFPERTGALIDVPGFLPGFSAARNLQILADMGDEIDRSRIAEVLTIVGLDVENRQPVHTYSVGMRKRLGLAQAILEEPALLLLDEPTDSIDQAGWKNVYEYLIQLKEKGSAILLTSNNLDEITILCDQAYILKDKQLFPTD
ncbi:MAG: ATP-binding cassette domain-containing protein [Chloroflexi bacterium]|nr:ATP-binding cassette domain-containing protein [Chloroflexota bacterium]